MDLKLFTCLILVKLLGKVQCNSVLCTDYVDDACQFWKCDLETGVMTKMPDCPVGMGYSKLYKTCVPMDGQNGCTLSLGIGCQNDKVDSVTCRFHKCLYGQYTEMPKCPGSLTFKKTGDFVCVPMDDPDACIPTDGLITDQITGPVTCDPSPCLNGGQCVQSVSNGGYSCSCINGYSGPICHIGPTCSVDMVDLNTCRLRKCVHGHYTEMPKCPHNMAYRKYPDYVCVLADDPDACVPTSGGLVTDNITSNACNPNPCQHNGYCMSSLNGDSYMCVCMPGYSGANCQIGPCSTSPCLNGGTCTNTATGYQCQCPQNVGGFSFSGQNCELKSQSLSDVCSSVPCRNGGQCQPSETGFTCNCLSGFSGQFCEIVSTTGVNCASTPCLNGGTCLTLTSGFYCACPATSDSTIFYTGKNCENLLAVDYFACRSSPCLHGGTCIATGTAPGYRCSCVVNSNGKTYAGMRCEEEITSSAITEVCQSSSSVKFPDDEECQRYYDCSLVYATIPLHFKQHLDECIYPQVFNDVTSQCDDFINVDCGTRKVLLDGCEYARNKPKPGHSEPCANIYPSCKNKQDGQYEHPSKPMSPYYITCYHQRMMGISNCSLDNFQHAKIFYKGTCTSVFQIPITDGGRQIDCTGQVFSFHSDLVYPNIYTMCINGRPSVMQCPPNLVFNTAANTCTPG